MERKNNIKVGIILILMAATMSSLGQLAWKFGAESSQAGLTFFFYVLGFLAAGLGMVFMMISFRFGDVSILQPMMSIGFALSIIFGYFFLHEPITNVKIIGTFFIIGGSALLGYVGGKDDE